MEKDKDLSRRQFLGGALATGLGFGSWSQDSLGAQTAGCSDEKSTKAVSFGPYQVKNSKIKLDLAITSKALLLTGVRNEEDGCDHLLRPTSFFNICDAEGTCELGSGWVIDGVHAPSAYSSLHIVGHLVASPVTFFVVFSALDAAQISVKLRLRNDGLNPVHLRLMFPRISNLLSAKDGRKLHAVIPQEAGGHASYEENVNLGMGLKDTIGLPTAMNIMELVSIYDPLRGGGLYLLDAEGASDKGIAPIQFTLLADVATGYWITDLEPLSEQALPALYIGVHSVGDWHVAVDEYVKLHPSTPDAVMIPTWFRDQGAIYSFSGAGAGAIYMDYPQQDLSSRITSFHDLPKLLGEAQSLGTNIVYLWDYWQGANDGDHPPYWNKGDYKARLDLGGDAALRAGIDAVHRQGGKVIVYLEWYIMYWYADVCRQHGEQWAARDVNGNPYREYAENFSLSPAPGAWHDYIINVAIRMVKDFDVDGIYLDSMGWQMNWPILTLAERRRYSSKEYTAAALSFVDNMRVAIRGVKSDAIVIGESTSGVLPTHWDGGLSADFAWLAAQNQHKILASPARYGIRNLNIYSNGHDRNEMHQIFAAGHSLALANVHLADAPYIKTLVTCRQKYKDALIYGRQTHQPKTGNGNVAAYFYKGQKHDVITIVNTSKDVFTTELTFETSVEEGKQWLNVLEGHKIIDEPGILRIALEAHSLQVFAADRQ